MLCVLQVMDLQLTGVNSGVEYRSRPDRGESSWTSGPGNIPPPTFDAVNGVWLPYTTIDGQTFYNNCLDAANNAVVCSLLHEYRIVILPQNVT